MIDGITVLSQTTQWTAGGVELFVTIFFGVIFLIVGGFAITCFMDGCGNSIGFGLMFTVSAVVCVVGGFQAFDDYSNRKPYETYKVIITDNVNFSDFTDKYEIISQDGKIFNIKEKVKEN